MANNLDILLQSLLTPQATQQRSAVILAALSSEYPDFVLSESVLIIYPSSDQWGLSTWGTMTWGA